MNFIHQSEPFYGKEERKAINDYLKSGGWLTDFKKTREFEKMICDYTGAKHCSIMTSAAVGLFVALKAMDVSRDDEVLVPDVTMVATPNAVVLAGARPVFVDVSKDNLCMDVDLIKKAVTRKTKAIMYVSLNGRSDRLDELKSFCKEKKIAFIEDSAQSLGSFHRGKHLGTYGDIGVFSFSSHKLVTAGQGGAVVTNNKKLHEKIMRIKDYGRLQGGEDYHPAWGWNFKFTDLQAVFGIEQMKKVKERSGRKKEIYSLYRELLSSVPEVEFLKMDLNQVTPWFVDIFVSQPKALKKHLIKHNIGSRFIYPAIHTQPIYKNIRGKFPVSLAFSRRGLWLPSSLTLTNKDIKRVCSAIKIFYSQ